MNAGKSLMMAAVALFAIAPWNLVAQAGPGGPAPAAPTVAPAGAPAAGPEGRGPGRRGNARSNWPPAGPTPHAADGHPDLSGNWEPNAIGANVDMVRDLARTGATVPFQPWAEKLYNERKANISKDDPEARCLPPGVPRMSTTPYPFRIVQTPNLTVIVYEGGAHIWRQIFTDGRKHSEDPNPSWLGESIGHWEDDTFVVDTVGNNGKTWIDESGLPTSDALHVIERFKRIDLGHMEIEHTVDDPKVYTKPWNFTTHPSMLKGELIEYICQENNKDVEHLIGK
ncbi:MAG: hypothetical protein LAP40_24370 [Acidobacteriia bacterium]|nr:hypothetical protein [Terriglobia bacterium]